MNRGMSDTRGFAPYHVALAKKAPGQLSLSVGPQIHRASLGPSVAAFLCLCRHWGCDTPLRNAGVVCWTGEQTSGFGPQLWAPPSTSKSRPSSPTSVVQIFSTATRLSIDLFQRRQCNKVERAEGVQPGFLKFTKIHASFVEQEIGETINSVLQIQS